MIKKIATIAIATIIWGAVTASVQNEKADQSCRQNTEQSCKEKKSGNKELMPKMDESAGIRNH